MVGSGVQWGTLGEWASAVGALIVIGVTLRLWRHEVGEKARAEERRVAEGVNAWIQSDAAYARIVSNQSTEPIYAWEVEASWERRTTSGGQPGANRVIVKAASHDRAGPLPPGRPYREPINSPPWPGELASIEVTMTFTEPRGTRWRRVNGTLTKLPKP